MLIKHVDSSVSVLENLERVCGIFCQCFGKSRANVRHLYYSSLSVPGVFLPSYAIRPCDISPFFVSFL